MVLPERQEVSKRFSKTSRWSTYFVYARTQKTRGFSEVFDFRFSVDIFRIFPPRPNKFNFEKFQYLFVLNLSTIFDFNRHQCPAIC